MATTAYKEEEIKLENGDKINVKPLNIKNYRKFMEEFQQLEGAKTETEAIDIIMNALTVAVGQYQPELAEDRDKLEEAFSVPTVWRVIEIAAGIEVDNPNLQRAGLVGRS